jgi:CHASE3 domain sensor protein
MKKQFTLNLDALLVLALVFLITVGFMSYQRNQYSDLLEEHIQLQWSSQDLEVDVVSLKAKLKQCSTPEKGG